MDYITLSSILGNMLPLLISYDIACQWYKHLFKRMEENFPSDMRMDESIKDKTRFAIPKKH